MPGLSRSTDTGPEGRERDMATIFFDTDADLKSLDGLTLGVIGYGNQGRSQALNLRDSGMRVIVGSRKDPSADAAQADGFEVGAIAQVARTADVLFLLVPDEIMCQVYEDQVAQHLRPGATLVFASGYNICMGLIKPPPTVDVVLVAPRMIGRGVRDTYLRGQGFPSLIGVAQDASGRALSRALAVAKGIGSTRAGAVMSSFEEETCIDLFTEQAGELYFPRLMYEVLTEAGFSPEAVLMELYASGEQVEVWAAAQAMGMWGQLQLHSRTSQYGQQVTSLKFMDVDAMRDSLRKVLEHIRSGEFAREWQHEQATGLVDLIAATNRNLRHPMNLAENRLYRLLGRRAQDLNSATWLEAGEGEGGDE